MGVVHDSKEEIHQLLQNGFDDKRMKNNESNPYLLGEE